ncbi:MAG TPA: polysaccharide deacetylase family protein [Ktedonobacteraceae bacterium]|nr:polysaccharide deacetylase family protein [Ktedonobacteraceae bacterium]
MSRRFEKNRPDRALWPLIIIPLLCIGSLATGIFLLSKTDLSTKQHQQGKSLLTASHLSLVPVIQKEAGPQVVAHDYMTALVSGQYNTMWSLLSPQMQAQWPGEAAYASFWQARYRDYNLQGFSIGGASPLSQWVDPETMAVYSHVEEMPVSLRLQPDQTLRQEGQLPPEDQHPDQVLKNLPFIVEAVSNAKGAQSHWLVLDGGPGDPEAPILPPLNPASKTVQVPILMYHHVSDTPPQNVLDESLTVTPAMFKQQLDYLQRQGYHTITFNQMFDALYFGAPLPTRPIILTLDDGYADVYHFALPLLQQHHFTATFYIISGKVGWQGYMDWGNLQDLLRKGMQIGSHTVHHVDVGATYLDSPALAQVELQQSKATLEKQLGIVIQQFCYPSGEPFRSESVYLQQKIVALLWQDGYVGATTDPGRTGIDQESQAPFDLLRIRVDGRETFAQFVYSLPW